MDNFRKAYNKGFTLVELAIVLMIIGLLIAGVLKGQELARNAKIKGVMKEINSYSAAITSFRDAYNAQPGDMATATMRLSGCTAANNCVNGDGNNLVGQIWAGNSGWDTNQAGSTTLPQIETAMFWKHMMLAGFTTGTNPAASAANPVWGETHPVSVMGGGYHVFTDTQSAGSNISLRLQGPVTGNPSGSPGGRPLTGNEALTIDRKMDDGNPGSGYFWGIPFGNDGCRNNTGPTAYYVPNSLNKKNCSAHMIVN